MSDLTALLPALLSGSWLLAALAALVGLVIGRVLGGFAGPARPAPESDRHRRGIEAELRVAQKTVEDQRAQLAATSTDLATLRAAQDDALAQAGSRDERLRRLKAELQAECAKTAKLRQELAERAEEMVRTHVQLRDTRTELGVARVGSDVILEQIARLEQERDDLNALVGNLRAELVSRQGAGDAPAAPGRDPVVGA
jgi:uncharacterized membrane-anchored protein YhcB (DUF1043 family)